MNWKWRFALLMIAALPAFTGYPFRPMPAAIVPGLTWAWAGYGLGVHLLLMALVGRRGYAGALSVAALVTAPVVFFGGVISYALTGLTAGRLVPLPADSPHYLQLCLNMLTVIPLGLGIIMTVPFSRFEQSLIRRPTGVSALEKTALMALRVFNHIVFFVIPGILEVLREENVHGRHSGSDAVSGTPGSRLRALMRQMIHVGVDGICMAVRYIPLWAVEIAHLPARGTTPHRAPMPPGEDGGGPHPEGDR